MYVHVTITVLVLHVSADWKYYHFKTTVVLSVLLQDILPEGYNHHLCQFDSKENGFSASLRLDVRTEEGAKTWKKEFEESSLITWRVMRTRPSLSRYVLFKVCLTVLLIFTDCIKPFINPVNVSFVVKTIKRPD